MNELCGPGLAVALWEEGMLAEMFYEKMENGGSVWERAEFVS